MSAQKKGRMGRGHAGRLQRRGTVLLMVVGVLALMSIVAVVYVTIGQQDRRGAAAMVREQRLDDQSKTVADYLATIIADDVVAAAGVVDPADPTGTQIYVREAWDVASFDNKKRSQTADPNLRFDPVGQGTDPWLSSPEPSWLRFQPNDAPRAGGNQGGYLDNLDWEQISDPWPDGRFVNLGNIRGNFAVEPGIGTTPGTQLPRTSWGLTLFGRGTTPGPDVGRPQRVGTPRSPTPNNLILDNGANLPNPDENVPWHWATRQVNAFRPYRDVDRRVGAVGVGALIGPGLFSAPGLPEYLQNQWCDADGDGLVDSRWSDGVDTTIWNAPRSMFRADGSMRIFIASRIIDLSGLVNVNTAGDLHAPIPADGTGDARYPLGLTPGDIDLRSLLTASKVHDVLGANQVFELYEQPQTATAPPSDYSDDYGTPYNEAGARSAGLAGYSALRRSLKEGRLYPGPIDIGNGGEVFRRADKYEAFQRIAANEGARHTGTGVGQYQAAFGYGIDNMAELLTYWGTNDPNVTSALESTLDGRWGTLGSPESRLGPMRSNRGLSVERDGVGNFFPIGALQTAPHVQNDGLADDDALLKMRSDVRHLLTTVSGSRPIISSPVSGPGAPLTNAEVAQDVYELLDKPIEVGVPEIFRGYCQALLPWSDANLPNQGLSLAQPRWVIEGIPTKPDRARTMSYGWRGPELPLLMSAFMAVNLKDAYDADGDPTSFTLVIDDSFKTTNNNWRTQRFPAGNFPDSITSIPPLGGTESPFWPWNGSGGAQRRLDLGALTTPERIASTSDNRPPLNDPTVARPLAAPAVNIFGVEAQPFITQAALYACFTDRPENQGGDDDSVTITTPPQDPLPVSMVTLKGGANGSNNDFIFQVIAFQIHNPFDSSVSLTRYSLQFGNSRFQFSDTVPALGQRETKVFYCINPGLTTANSRISSAWTSGSGQPAPTSFLSGWLSYQLGIDASNLEQHRLKRFTVGTTNEITDATILDFLDTQNESNRVVLLWRDEINSGGGGQSHQILVDRMRDPELTGIPSLDRNFKLPMIVPLAGSDNENVDGTDTSDPSGPDNTGFSLVTFGSFRRPDDPGAGGRGIPLGAIPAFCVERRTFEPGGTNTDRPLNIGPTRDSSLRDGFGNNLGPNARMTRSDFIGSLGSSSPGRITLAALLDPQLNSEVLLPSIKQNPRTRSGQVIDPNLATPPVPYNRQYPEAFLPNNRFRIPAAGGQPEIKTLRPTDLLLPWALGSWELPGASGMQKWQSERRAKPAIAEPRLEWTTLSEMVAVALDYEQPRIGQKDIFMLNEPPSPLWRAGKDAYDRGCLRVDRFVPFMDLTNDMYFGYKPVGAGVPAQTPEDIVPPGIPLAASVVDRFRVRSAGSITRMVPGLVNVNTAPLEVIRALPGLTPPNASLDTAPGAVWFWNGVQDSLCDIASTMIAYRDNIGVWPRSIATGGTSSEQLNFRPDNNPGGGANPNTQGRRLKTQIQGLHQPRTIGTGAAALDAKFDRSENGFRSIGETMLVRDQTAGDPPAGQLPDETSYPFSIDRLGRDGVSVGGRRGDPPIFLADTTRYNSGGTMLPNEIVDDYQEQFAISGALMNSISVRSDVFAVWFVLRGYTVGDVEGLDVQDPMVPSVERRFLMIVDRSNVTQRGQKPKILLFKELPM